MLFGIDIFHVDKMVAVFLMQIIAVINSILSLQHQVKRTQALLGSNLPGIGLMADEKVKERGSIVYLPFLFLKPFIPLKTHL